MISITAAESCEPALTPTLARKLLQEFARPAENEKDADALTVREREVLELMVEGITSNRRLAKRLGVSENTVKFHVRNILDKLRLHTHAEWSGTRCAGRLWSRRRPSAWPRFEGGGKPPHSEG